MAYVAVKGGQEAIEKSIELLSLYRTNGEKSVKIEAIKNRMSLLVDKIMGEAGFYAPDYAALALKQSEGSVEEAVFLLRAYRSTLSRNYYSIPVDCEQMTLIRRISSAFKDVPDGQFLGPTYDYTHRLLQFSLMHEDKRVVEEIKRHWEDFNDRQDELKSQRVTTLLKQEGLIITQNDDSEPIDITQSPLTFPAPRSARLQTIARAETGYVCGLAYAGIRGFGPAHPTIGELRTGMAEVCIVHPLYPNETIVAGEICLTEVESLFPVEDKESENEKYDPLKKMQAGQGDKADISTNKLSLGVGYGLVFGRSDNKAIAMSILDYLLQTQGNSILQDQEFVLLHGDCLEMSGFISHLKLPHYVTFQSKLDRVRNTRRKEG